MNQLFRGCALGAALSLAVSVAHGATIIIEPDDYTGDVSEVAPAARLFTWRDNGMLPGPQYQKVYSVPGGSWTPTGTQVFGHTVTYPGEVAYHWDNVWGPGGAWNCDHYDACGEFKIFGVRFYSHARSVKILTTIRGEQALDPVDFWAFDPDGNRILQCRLYGITTQVLQGAPLPPPHLVNLPVPTKVPPTCGSVIEVKNCAVNTDQPGDCDYVVEMVLNRRQGDIGTVWFGGMLYQNTHANVDRLIYTIP